MGGKGGDVSVIANENLTLEDVFKRNKTKRYVAQNGRHSSHNFILGIAGEDLKFEIPTGVTIIDETGKKLGKL